MLQHWVKPVVSCFRQAVFAAACLMETDKEEESRNG